MRFRRTRLLIVGCGDVGLRAAAALPARVRVLALSSSPARYPELRARGIAPLAGNLDQPTSLRRLASLAPRVLHLAPPPGQGEGDPRTRALLRALARGSAQSPGAGFGYGIALVYGSTSGVYGDCAGALIDETRTPRPLSARARRRVAAERMLRDWGRHGAQRRVSILRIPGIYAPDRPGGTPRERLLAGTPTLRAEDDVYTSHIHADDLARACLAALWRGRAHRIYHASDDTRLKLGDYLDLAAERYGLPSAPRLTRAQAEQALTPERMSFLRESRQLDNRRLKQELRLRLRHPTVVQGL
ncbi:NAD-dependent epimerase/dehydratase family protein [Hylemonella gracilis]|uniref:NAD-dependent epimerase/dehydratase family protein n=2 Tax=Hylemonella gracilis TaxID=80880 RepID=A0A4V1A259_9BURK|nr:NAD-dependent epimerase/dehydratase family protein [Hylemonella gracilis]QBK04909.1 NAD-dependent epimerase/dehydratase family protein [Hylemonella gracilis]